MQRQASPVESIGPGLGTRSRFGPAGWSYPDWVGPIYRGTGEGLALLASVFDTVEVNTTFYRLPSPELARGWLRKVAGSPGFLFTAKLWQGFTHERGFGSSDVIEFRAGIEPLQDAGRLGAVLVQFPWSFRDGDGARGHLRRLFEAFRGVPLVVEVRHASWDRPDVRDLLREHDVGFCNLDQPLFRDSLAATDHVTSAVGYVRLHGRNAAAWFDPRANRDRRYDYLYAEDELRPWAERIRSIERRARRVFVVTNNHFRGQAVANALELRALCGVPAPSVPARWLDAFPRLAHVARPDRPRTLDLFATFPEPR